MYKALAILGGDARNIYARSLQELDPYSDVLAAEGLCEYFRTKSELRPLYSLAKASMDHEVSLSERSARAVRRKPFAYAMVALIKQGQADQCGAVLDAVVKLNVRGRTFSEPTTFSKLVYPLLMHNGRTSEASRVLVVESSLPVPVVEDPS